MQRFWTSALLPSIIGLLIGTLALTGCDDAPVASSDDPSVTASADSPDSEAPGSEAPGSESPSVPASECSVVTATPQDAVNAASPGDVVCVEDGTYAGTLTIATPDVTVVALSPRGARITGGDAPIGSAVRIEADGVTFEGFEVTFPGGLIGVTIGANTAGVTVRDNRVFDLGPTGRLGVTGIIADGGNRSLTIEGNLVEDLRNEFTSNDGFPTVNGIFANDDRADGFTGSVIRDNVVQNLKSDNAVLGILLQGTLADVDVQGNVIENLSADPANDSNGADDSVIYDDNLDDGFDGTLATFAQGVNIDAAETSAAEVAGDVRVTRNVIRGVRATGFNGEAVKVDGGARGLTVEFNDLLSTVGFSNGTPEAVAATCNYWGHPLGPRIVDDNPSADDDPNPQNRSAQVGAAETRPWLVRSIARGTNIENACVGGRGDSQNGRGRR